MSDPTSGYQVQQLAADGETWLPMSPVLAELHHAIDAFETKFPEKTLKQLKAALGVRIVEFRGDGEPLVLEHE